MSKVATGWAEEAEQRVLDGAVSVAPQSGWRGAYVRAAREAGMSVAEAELLMPGGARDLAALLSRRHDQTALETLAKTNPSPLKIRDRIRAAVLARLDAAKADQEAVRPWAGFLAFPTNLPLALRLVWESSDHLWRWAGDTSTDENHYSKRAILSGILISTLAIDLGQGRDAALTHLNARIDNVMSFEKWKAGFKPSDLAKDVAAALARIRYG
ncbi:MAG: rpsU-divergently transcribed protein [Caulobacter sp.]|nr:rpsU-divergently transcribed protein [Caulobacter sp.]